MQIASNYVKRTENYQGTKTTGRASLMLYPHEYGKKSPEQMLNIIASVLSMPPETFKMKSRKTEVVDLRFIGAHILRRFYPRITLKQIGAYFGGKDHTSIINALTRADELLYVNDRIFSYKYIMAFNTVIKWVRELQ